MRASKRLLTCLSAASFAFGLQATAQDSNSDATGPRHAEGIWKAVVPKTAMRSEFDGFDPIGIAAGVRIKADCSLNWVNPDDGTRYCFSSGTSLEFFLENPHTRIARARAEWLKLQGRPGA
jgi:hypothetical protein